MLDDSFHQRYCFSEKDQQLFRGKAMALAHLFLHLPSHHIIRLGGGKCALNENSFGWCFPQPEKIWFCLIGEHGGEPGRE